MTDTALTPSEADPATLAPFELRYLVLAAQREGNRALGRQLAPLGLTSSQFEIILVLDQYGPVSLKELGELIVCETGSPSRIVDTLVKRGYVERTPHLKDRRALELKLTDAGRQIVPHLREIDRAIDEGARLLLDPADLTGLATALRTYLTGSESGAVLERRFRGAPPADD
ncbi:MarR family winged helix-turn-helix transcriptional regulator [Microbacterium oleivorans]|uniref:MarR family transcriptional regulator n=1 Tax=Microbacterium oleivorans TaxID=273677 RepID=A0A4R5YGP2_9MICO|nr:MarR family transcriptional regulator [Microbacterium oleivorans]TDL44036.1 MarR family transcriptional regulator [Microbacterium oleivorans]